MSDKFWDEISDKLSESSILVMNLMQKFSTYNVSSTYNVAVICNITNTSNVASIYNVASTYNAANTYNAASTCSLVVLVVLATF